MKSPIYTMSGDKGRTSTLCGQKVTKCHVQVQAYGAIDELNATLGVVLASLPSALHKNMAPILTRLQHQLFNLGSHMATQGQAKNLPPLEGKWLEHMEQSIDSWDAQMPKLRNFVLPQGTPTAAHLHCARTVCRRAERQCVAGLDKLPQLIPTHVVPTHTSQAADSPLEATKGRYLFVIKYLNRLSDFLFVAARYANFLQKHNETLWAPSCN